MTTYQIATTCVALSLLTGCVLIDATSTSTAVAPAAAPTVSTSALSQQAAAQVIIDRAIEASGGLSALGNLRNGEMTLSVRNARIGQDTTPEAEPELGEASRTVIARNSGLIAIERFNGENLGSRYVSGALGDWIWFAGPNTVADVEPILAAGLLAQANTSAHILLDASDRSEYLRAAGQTVVDGKTYDLVSYADKLGRLQTLSFDTATGELAQIESLNAHAQWGDVAAIRSFSDYRNIGSARLAHLATNQQRGVTVSEFRVEGFSTSAVDEARFEKPASATQNDPFTAPSSEPRDLTVELLSPGVHFIENAAQGYNVVFADQDDGILIIETPQSPQAARDILRTVKATLPGKKIKAAVPTHHHFDHSGGLYGFLEAGVPILTTPGNIAFVKDIGATPRNIGQNARGAISPVVSAFNGDTTHGTGATEVRIINVGPNPHADEIVIAYIPAIKAVFVADLFSARGEELPPANANQLAFADRLKTLNLEIDTFIPVHGRKATAAEFWGSVEAGRAAATE